MDDRKTIPAEEQVPYTRWEMPDLTGVRRRIAQRLDELEQQAVAMQEPAALQKQSPADTEEATAEVDPEILLEELRQEAFQQGFQQGREAGWTSGYTEGLAAGREAGYAAGQQAGQAAMTKTLQNQLQRLQDLFQQLQSPLQVIEQETEVTLLALVDTLCSQLLRRELCLDRSHLQQLLHEALALLPPGYQQLRIFVHPDDLRLLQPFCEQLESAPQLLADPRLLLGSLRIETSQSLVDLALDKRYRQQLNALTEQAYAALITEAEVLPQHKLTAELPEVAPLSLGVASLSPPVAESSDAVPKEDTATAVPPPPPMTAPVMPPIAPPAAKVTLNRKGAARNLPPVAQLEPQSAPSESGDVLPESLPLQDRVADTRPEQPEAVASLQVPDIETEQPAAELPQAEETEEAAAEDTTTHPEARPVWSASTVHADHYLASEDGNEPWLEQASVQQDMTLPDMDDDLPPDMESGSVR